MRKPAPASALTALKQMLIPRLAFEACRYDAILINQGGMNECSESRLQLIRRFAAAACLAEQLESRLANGEQIDIGEHAKLSSTLVRLAAKIDIDRRVCDVTPSLAEYLAWAHRDAETPEDESEDEPAAEAALEEAPTSELSDGPPSKMRRTL